MLRSTIHLPPIEEGEFLLCYVKPHKCHKTQISNRTVFINRTYQDFQTLHLESFTEMDTVHSS